MKSAPELAAYDDCTGCMLCADTCPKSALSFAVDENGFWTPQINPELCIGCKLCEKQCRAVRSNGLRPIAEMPYKGHAVSDAVRRRSTSGGIFYALAEHAIRGKQGVVFGAVCEGLTIRHHGVETLEELQKLQGSKYAQSNTSGIYKQVKHLLKAGRFVLFSGTPCQVQALHTHLGKEYENLITVDLICHGVPSYKLMERHLAVNKGEAVEQFRTKSFGWGRDSYITMTRGGRSVTVTNRFRNLFYHMFQNELAFRPNCYQCRFNTIHRAGDITIGDYWQARNTPEYDPLGISTILPNSEQGARYLAECADLVKEPVPWAKAISNNPRLITHRKEFLSFCLSRCIGKLYNRLPAFIADRLLGALHSKRRPFSLLWSCYLQQKRSNYQQRFEQEEQILREKLSTFTTK